MHVSAEAHVVGKIPARMVRIVVNDDIVGIPEPAAAVGYVVGSDAPVPSVEPEAAWAATGKMPDVMRTETACPMTMLPRVVEMIVGVVRSGIVADPDLSVDMRDTGVAFLVTEVVLRFVGVRRSVKRARAMSGWRAVRCTVLCKCR